MGYFFFFVLDKVLFKILFMVKLVFFLGNLYFCFFFGFFWDLGFGFNVLIFKVIWCFFGLIFKIFICIWFFLWRILWGVVMCLWEIWEICINFFILGKIFIKVLKFVRCFIVLFKIVLVAVFVLIFVYGLGNVFLIDKEICFFFGLIERIFIWMFLLIVNVLFGLFICWWVILEIWIKLFMLFKLMNVLKFVKWVIFFLIMFLLCKEESNFFFFDFFLVLIIVLCERIKWFFEGLILIILNVSVWFLYLEKFVIKWFLIIEVGINLWILILIIKLFLIIFVIGVLIILFVWKFCLIFF